jgi:hypothetical protein
MEQKMIWCITEPVSAGVYGAAGAGGGLNAAVTVP